MNVLDTISPDILNYLIFIMPGFFFFWIVFGKKNRSDTELVVFSLFWGIILMFLYHFVIPKDEFNSLIKNPYLAAVILSIASLALGFIALFLIWLIKIVIRKLNRDRWDRW